MEWTKDKFYRMYEEYNGMVYRLCMLYLKNESDAGDAVQDIFLKMWEKEPVFANEVHIRAWLLRTTKHTCLDILKSGWFKEEQIASRICNKFHRNKKKNIACWKRFKSFRKSIGKYCIFITMKNIQ